MTNKTITHLQQKNYTYIFFYFLLQKLSHIFPKFQLFRPEYKIFLTEYSSSTAYAAQWHETNPSRY